MKNIFVLGSLNMDLSIFCDRLPQAGETILGDGFLCNGGGKGANQAVAASKLGGKVKMLGAVGNDVFGLKLVKGLKKYRVDVKNVLKKNTSTGVAVIVVEKDNRIILDSGANYAVKFEEVEQRLTKQAKEGDYLIVQLEIPFSVVEKTLILAKKLKMVTLLNPAPAARLSENMLSSVDYLIPNETEAELLTGISYNGENIKEICNNLLQKKVKNVIITLGDKGCVYCNGSDYLAVASKKVAAVDTTAAGDTFIGAFAAQLSRGDNVQNALTFANTAASITVTRKGSQQAIPSLAEVCI